MTLLYGSHQVAVYNYIIEDPDVSKQRIFIENQGMNIGTLSPKFGEYWYHQDTTDQYAPSSQGDDYGSYAPIQTNNGKWCWGPLAMYARQEYWSYPGQQDPWMASLDYENIPGKTSIKTSQGYVVVQTQSGLSTNNTLADWWFGTDMNSIPSARIVNDGDYVVMFYEDPNAANEWWGINYDNDSQYVGRIRFTPTTKTWTTVRTAGASVNIFYLGQLTDTSPVFVEVNGNTQNMDFYKYTSGGATGASAVLLASYCAPGPSTWHYQYPSNVRKDSTTRIVFYQGGWNTDPVQEFKQAIFTRVIFNPTSGDITFQPCTITYPGTTKHTDYQRSFFYNAAWHAATKNAWYYKCHQFTLNGVNYLTFLSVDRYQPNTATERAYYYRNDKRNTWVTFAIGSGSNDDQLTYHSTFEWVGSSRNYPRYYCPVNAAGTQLFIVKNEWVSTLSFDAVKGWYEHDQEEISARSFGIDAAGRVFVGATGYNTYYDTDATRYDYGTGKGYMQYHLYNYSQPTTITVTPAATTFTYAGTAISSSLLVSVRDYTGNLTSKNLKLTLSGANVTFSDGSQSTVVTTTSTTSTSVGILITGAGRPLVTANIV